MRRPFKCVHGGFSTLSLLGVSTILLAAAGETLWHANSAATSEGRWAAPRVGVEAEAPAGSASSAEAESEMLTVPIFKPFVLVRIPLPSGYSSGEVMALNEAGQAVGWMWNDSAEITNAFFFDPANSSDANNGVVILDTDDQNMDAAWAFGISDETPPTIAGQVIWKSQPNYLRASLWDGPDDTAYVPLAPGVVSAAYGIKAVASATTLVGMYQNSGQEQSVYYDGSFEYPASGVEGKATSLNWGGEVAGWHKVNGNWHAYSWASDTTTDIHPSGWDQSGANCINSNGDVAGWALDAPGGRVPALWVVDPQGFYTFAPFTSVGAQSEAMGINSYGEMAITNTTGTGGGAIWQVISSANVASNCDTLTLMPDSTGHVYSARAINDNLWIGGSYNATSQSDPQPCLIIPYDVDNDGDPDYREIVNGAEDDENENWLIDWAENTRVGINNPGYAVPGSNPAHAIQNTRVVSLPLHIAFLPENLGEDEYSINGVLDEQCEDFRTAIEHWARATQADPQEREVSILLHSSLGDELGEDYLPGNGNEYDRAQQLTSIRKFAYQYAWCVDYVQTGNEVFGGAGCYRFYYDSELFECDGWQGVRTFQQLDADCKEEAVFLVRDWLGEQAWAALEGSALAGRPLRIIGPGIIHAHVLSAAEDPPGAVGLFIMEAMVPWLNDNQMYFDMHLHYRSIADGHNAIDDLTDPNSNWGGPPNWKVSREFGPAAEDQWALDNWGEYKKFRKDYTTQGPCESNCCQEEPSDGNWDNFTLRWRQQKFSGDFEMDNFLAALAGDGWTFVAYGPVHQEAPPAMVFDVAALRANRICWDWMDQQNRSQTTLFTPLTDEYETEASNYEITFPQNRRTCPECE